MTQKIIGAALGGFLIGVGVASAVITARLPTTHKAADDMRINIDLEKFGQSAKVQCVIHSRQYLCFDKGPPIPEVSIISSRTPGTP